jgi:hypothetical protein
MNGAMQRVRAVSEQIRLVAARDVQLAAGLIRQHTSRLHQAATAETILAVNDALQAYYRAVRGQLGVPATHEVMHDDDLDRHPTTVQIRR